MSTELTKTEQSTLAKLEATIERGKKAFVEVGTALAEIRDGKLYRHEHATFEAYTEARWGWKRAHAYRLIEAAEVKLSPMGDKIANERQARALASVPEPEREAVLEQAAEKAAAENRDLTARDITEAAEVQEPEPEPEEPPRVQAEVVEPEPNFDRDFHAITDGVWNATRKLPVRPTAETLRGYAKVLRAAAIGTEELAATIR